MPELLLASASPRRRDILENLGIRFRVISAPEIDETAIMNDKSISPSEIASRLALKKASAIRLKQDELALTADTVVVIDGEILGKPGDNSEARLFIEKLSGKKHDVITAIVLKKTDSETYTGIETTGVYFRTMTSEEIDWYIASGEPFGKAGGYAIQGLGGLFIHRVDGCYFNVVGLPVFRLMSVLHEAGYDYRDFFNMGNIR